MEAVISIFVLLLIVIFYISFTLFLLVLIIYFSSALFVWPPSIPTDRKARRAIVEFLKTKYNTDGKFKVVDLGSGYGHLIKEVLKNFPNAEITGVELLLLPYHFSKFIFRNKKNIRIIKDDLYAHNLSEYDAIVFFLRKDHKMDDKVKSEVKNGALIVSNNFPLKNYKPKQINKLDKTSFGRVIYFYQK